MANLSPILSNVASTIKDKGSIYGKASNTPSPHSFQQLTRSYQSVHADRIEILSNEATLFSSRSITIEHEEQTRDLIT